VGYDVEGTFFEFLGPEMGRERDIYIYISYIILIIYIYIWYIPNFNFLSLSSHL